MKIVAISSVRRLDQELQQADELYEGFADVSNPISQYWDIELFVYKEIDGGYTFKVKFTSKQSVELPNGEVIFQSVFVDEVDFEDRGRSIRRELRKRGMMDDVIFWDIKSYVQLLKSNKQYTFCDNVKLLSNNTGDLSKNIKQESEDCYDILVQEVKNNPEAFPMSTEAFVRGESDGIFTQDYKDSGCSAVIISGENLQDLLAVHDKTEFENIIRFWRDQGLLLSGDYKARRLTSKFTFCCRYRTTAYIIKMDQSLIAGR